MTAALFVIITSISLNALAVMPFSVGSYSATNRPLRSSNQDAVMIEDSGGRKLYGVFDGHGEYGGRASSYAREEFMTDFVAAQVRGLANRMGVALQSVDRKMSYHGEYDYSGTTASIICIGERGFTIAYTGDSPVVLVASDKMYDIPLHKAKLPKEQIWFRKYIKEKGFDRFSISRVDSYKVAVDGKGYLNITRTLGASRISIPAEPTIIRKPLSSKYEFIMLLSKGVTDSLTVAEAGKYVRGLLKIAETAQQAAQGLVELAIASGSEDNVSAVVIVLKDPKEFDL